MYATNTLSAIFTLFGIPLVLKKGATYTKLAIREYVFGRYSVKAPCGTECSSDNNENDARYLQFYQYADAADDCRDCGGFDVILQLDLQQANCHFLQNHNAICNKCTILRIIVFRSELIHNVCDEHG